MFPALVPGHAIISALDPILSHQAAMAMLK